MIDQEITHSTARHGVAILSIGENCCPAELLQGVGLRKESMLFDWARSNLSLVRDVIENGLSWHIEKNLRADPLPYYPDEHYRKLQYPHHPYHENRDWMVRCALRFFDALIHAESLFLVHCSPRPINPHHLIRLEETVSALRENFTLIGVQGNAGATPGIVSDVTVSDRIRMLKVLADKDFQTNKMRGPFYSELAQCLFGDVACVDSYGNS